MSCLKCGKETGISSVFCDSCLWKMAAYPVKPDIVVQLPNRPDEVEEKKPVRKKKQPTPAELLKKARRRVLWLSVTVLLLIVGLLISISLLVHTANALEEIQSHGKNYTTIIS